MKIDARSVEDYISKLPADRQKVITELRRTILRSLPEGFEETLSYGMIGYVVPHKLYPAGYHANPELPLPFINIASQKNHVAVYHSGVYADKTLFNWFEKAFLKLTGRKPDMGKSCIRFKEPQKIPFDLIGELCKKMSPQDWIGLYENARK